MNKLLLISAMQYDFHTLLKVADICGFTGEIGFHDAEDGYLLTFPDNIISGTAESVSCHFYLCQVRLALGRFFCAVCYPSATSSTIITLKPTAKNTVPRLECRPCDISGISSSTTT